MCLKKKQKTSGTQAAGECVTEIILQIFSEPRHDEESKENKFPVPSSMYLYSNSSWATTNHSALVFTSLYKRVFMAIIPIGVW